MGNHPAYISTAVAYPFIKNLTQNCDIYRKFSFGLFIFLFILVNTSVSGRNAMMALLNWKCFCITNMSRKQMSSKKSKWSLIIPQRYKNI